MGLVLVACALVVSHDNHLAAQSKIDNRFVKGDRERLIEALVNGRADVMLLIAADRGQNGSVAREAVALGGVIRYRDDDIDYLRVRMPTSRVNAVARLTGVHSISIDGEPQYRYSQADSPVPNPRNRARPALPSLPFSRPVPPDNPYLPIRDIGAPQFIARHPTFDGRGVTIAVIDGFADLLTPELQTARSLDGRLARKVVEILDATDPLDDENPYKVKMAIEVVARGGRFVHGGVSYTVRNDGHYRLGFFDERAITYPYLERDANRDGNPPGSSGVFPVLWDKVTGTVWVDTNQNRSFTDERGVIEYNKSFDVAVFGRDNPATPIRETCAFTVRIDPVNDFVFINLAAESHSTAVSGVAAGSRCPGGRFDGVAPGAQLVLIKTPAAVHGAIEAMILAAKHPKVDVITIQLSSRNRLNAGTSTVSVIWERLAERYKKLIFVSAGNFGPGLNTVGELSAGTRVISVGGYINQDTWKTLYGVDSDQPDNVMDGSVRGPADDGGFKPDLLAPMAAVSADPAMYSAQEGSDSIHLPLPPGYRAGNGTSFSAPIAAGSAALLISAARQSNLASDPQRVAWALKSGARFLRWHGAHEQGAGLVDVFGAWEALKRKPTLATIVSRAPVRTVESRYLVEPGVGRGIYEREGWFAGQKEMRTITFTRISGAATPLIYSLRWMGDDATFSSAAEIILPLDIPVELNVTINPKSSGVHSAILNLDDSFGNRSIYQIMCTVVAATLFSPESAFAATLEGTVHYPDSASWFLQIPGGVRALHVTLKASNRKSSLRVRFVDPSGKERDFSRPSDTWAPYNIGGGLERVIADPSPGTWEVIVGNADVDLQGARRAALLATRFRLHAVVLGAEVQKSDSGTQHRASPHTDVAIVNEFGPFAGALASSTLGSAYSTRLTSVTDGQPRIFDIEVPPGSALLNVGLGAVSDSAADLDLYLFNCTTGECTLEDYSIGAGATESISIRDPAGGKWRVATDSVSIPSGSMSYEYRDVFTNPAFGTLESRDKPAARSKGSTWLDSISADVRCVPEGGRFLAAIVEVTTDSAHTLRYRYNRRTFSGEALKGPMTVGSAFIRFSGDKGEDRRVARSCENF